jgi:hypothetical protein
MPNSECMFAATPDERAVARRRFIAGCGKFALATPPAMALLLASGKGDYAVAASGASSETRGRFINLAGGDQIPPDGLHPGDTICVNTVNGVHCHGIPAH